MRMSHKQAWRAKNHGLRITIPFCHCYVLTVQQLGYNNVILFEFNSTGLQWILSYGGSN